MLSDLDKEVVLSLADNNMNVTATSRVMFMHRNTVTYHLDKVKSISGLNPMNFYDLIKLVKMVKEEGKV